MVLQKGFHTTADLGSTEVLVTVQISDEFYKDEPRVCGYKTYIVDVLWCQPIKLIQVASTSESHENQPNNLLFFEIVPCHFCGASEVQT